MQSCYPTYEPLIKLRNTLMFIIKHKKEHGEPLSTISREGLTNFQGRAYKTYRTIRDPVARYHYLSIKKIIQDILEPARVLPDKDCFWQIAKHLTPYDFFTLKLVNRQTYQVAYHTLRKKIKIYGYTGDGSVERFHTDLKQQFFFAIKIGILPLKKKHSFERVSRNFYYSNIAKVSLLSQNAIYSDSFNLLRSFIRSEVSPKTKTKSKIKIETNAIQDILKANTYNSNTILNIIRSERENLFEFLRYVIESDSALIYFAAKYQGVAALKYFLSVNPKSINERSADGETPLSIACRNDNLEIVKCLLEAGADPNICTEKGDYPIQIAILTISLEALKCLLNSHVDCRVTDEHGRTPLELAQELNFPDYIMIQLARINAIQGGVKTEM